MGIVNNSREHFVANEKHYFMHGNGHRTNLILGTEPFYRSFNKKGLKLSRLFIKFSVYDLNGNLIGSQKSEFSSKEEVVFDSQNMFGETSKSREGSILVRVEKLEFEGDNLEIPSYSEHLNGVLLIYRPGQYVTGVHMYHGVLTHKPLYLLKHYLSNFKRLLVNFIRTFKLLKKFNLFSFPWALDAVGASVVRSRPSSKALVLVHSENGFFGVSGYLERRFDSLIFLDIEFQKFLKMEHVNT